MNDPCSRGRLSFRGISLSLVLLAGLFTHREAVGQDDLEREFFQGVASMEKEYKDFEQAAFEEFRREVRAMWQDFEISTEKDWVEYSEDLDGAKPGGLRDRRGGGGGPRAGGTGRTEPEGRNRKARPGDRAARRGPREGPGLPTARGAPCRRTCPCPCRRRDSSPPLLPSPVLEDQLQTQTGQPVTSENKKEFAREIVETRPVKETVMETEKGNLVKAQVAFSLVPDHLRVRGERYLASVRRESGRFDISVPLAFAVIHTESYFNPKATSPAPAYGLMQLVPRSGARDAYRFVYGQDRILPPDYLYVPGNNVELGCAYLGLLKNRYFRNVKDPQNALYCAVASYNTGAGNLSRSLAGKARIQPAIDRVNTMDPEELYTYLRENLPYAETRDYIKKVRERMRLYKEWE